MVIPRMSRAASISAPPSARRSPWRRVRGQTLDREPVPDMDGGLGNHPRRRAPVRPGGDVHDETMAQVNVPGLAGGVRDRPAQHRRAPEDGVSIGARRAAGDQELRHCQVRAADQPGRRVVRADVAEQEQRLAAARPGADVDPVPAWAVPAAVNDSPARPPGSTSGGQVAGSSSRTPCPLIELQITARHAAAVSASNAPRRTT